MLLSEMAKMPTRTLLDSRLAIALVASVLGATILTGCASSASKVRVDKVDASLPACQSFAWHTPSQETASFTDQRVRAAALATLEAKGYAIVEDKPDCKLSYSLASHEVAKPKPNVGVGVGGGSGGVGGGIGVSIPIGKKKGEAGTLTLDVIDASKNAQVWSGSIDGTFKTADLTDEEARKAVEAVLAEYPDRGGAAAR
jgi:hypothetical protein